MRHDTLATVFQTLRVDFAEYERWQGAGVQSRQVGADSAARSYALLSGECRLELGTGECFVMTAGDLIVLPHGTAHQIKQASPVGRADNGQPLAEVLASRPAADIVPRVHGLGPGPELVCGRIHFEPPGQRHFWELLPRAVLARRQVHTLPWLEATLQFITSEASSVRPGAQTLVNRLTDFLVLHVIRSHLLTLDMAWDGGSNWLAALADPQIGASLAQLHQTPGEPWTVGCLARKVGMSRSAFAARFTRLVGEPPLQYLTRLRMQHAARLLREGWASTAEVAERVGYVSDTAFCKAFKRSFGVSPGGFRRAERGRASEQAA